MESFTIILISLILFQGLAQARTPEEWKTRVIYQLLTDRFGPTGEAPPSDCTDLRGWCGGTFQGILQRLDYIQGLGANAIWISPMVLNTERGYHGYWAKNIYQIEPHFGSRDDLHSLISACHNRDIWVMLDVVPNHMGYPPGCDWNPCDDEKLVNFTGFTPFDEDEHYHKLCAIEDFTNQTQVELCRLANLPDLNQTVSLVKDTLLDWVEGVTSEFGFDGYRIDTVRHIAMEFWPDYQVAAGEFCLGEVASGNVEYTASYQGPQGLNSVLNFPLYYTIRGVFNEGQSMELLNENLIEQRAHFQDVTLLGLFADNHDAPRFLNFTQDVPLFQNSLVYVLFGEGIPIIYYGSEQSFKGGNDPNNRESLWPHYNTGSSMYEFLSSLIQVRHEHIDAMIHAPQTELYVDEEVMILTRANSKIVVAVTNIGSGKETSRTFQGQDLYDEYVNVLDPKDLVTVQGGQLAITLENGEPKVYLATSGRTTGGATHITGFASGVLDSVVRSVLGHFA